MGWPWGGRGFKKSDASLLETARKDKFLYPNFSNFVFWCFAVERGGWQDGPVVEPPLLSQPLSLFGKSLPIFGIVDVLLYGTEKDPARLR